MKDEAAVQQSVQIREGDLIANVFGFAFILHPSAFILSS
jgi:hypothetical protein